MASLTGCFPHSPVTKLGRLVKEGRIRSLEEIFLHSMFGPESTRNFQLRPFDFDRSFCVFRPFFWTVFSELRPIKEHQIVDHFFPPTAGKLKDEVMTIKPVQKQSSAGQRTRFKAYVAVGDFDGHIGLGKSRIRCRN